MKVKKVSLISAEYPELLRSIASPPKQLYVLGDLSKLAHTKLVGIVGSRAITPYGKQVTYQLAYDAASRGIGVVSGLALGVDAVAHQACLDAGGYTVAVLPSGLDGIHPATNRPLAIRILEQGGALISEYPPGSRPFKQNFIARNRLVSGLSEAVLVTEASQRSGALHTANFALEQGRSVLAVPGNITTTTSQGTNNLIKSGATPVTDIRDVLYCLGFDTTSSQIDVVGATAEEDTVLQLLRAGTTDINQLHALSKFDLGVFSQTMTMLEIAGKIRPLGGGQWTLA